ncbi:MAG: hypothetical protein AAGA48_21600 [Myxococcota bacterium]
MAWGLEAMIVIGLAVLGVLILPGGMRGGRRLPSWMRSRPRERMSTFHTETPSWPPAGLPLRGLRPREHTPLTVDPVEWTNRPELHRRDTDA